jgi:predicted Zn finger-like uncharacterized protein
MVAGCPKCNARYRVDVEKISSNGAKLRCTKCSAVFLVRAPRTPEAEAPAPEVPVEVPVQAPVQASIPDPGTQEEVDSSRLVLIADPDEARGKVTAEAILGCGLTPILVLDGVEAMLTIQRKLPAVIVLDAALPKMFGFQICEVVKRNESLRDTKVVLIGAIHQQDRYRRDPSDLYGDDVYIEAPDLPDALLPVLRDAGLSMNDPEPGEANQSATPEVMAPEPTIPEPIARVVAPAEAAAPVETPPVAQDPTPTESPAHADTADDEDPERKAERERAQRLARIAVSEMVLYQPEKFDAATKDGTLERALDLEIQEARALLRQRIGEETRAETDFIMDELRRVAQERGGQA